MLAVEKDEEWLMSLRGKWRETPGEDEAEDEGEEVEREGLVVAEGGVKTDIKRDAPVDWVSGEEEMGVEEEEEDWERGVRISELRGLFAVEGPEA